MQDELTDHKVNELNERIRIIPGEDVGPGGAPDKYLIELTTKEGEHQDTMIQFQKGPVKEVGFNGITHEALLAVIIDRLRCYQAGSHACRENALALTKCQEALMWLKERTKGRIARGVEGTMEK